MTTTAIVTAPGALPVFGHLVRLARDPLAFLTPLPAHGDLVEVRVGPLRMVVACDPPGWFFTRVVTTESRLGHHVLPTGTVIGYSPYIVHYQQDM